MPEVVAVVQDLPKPIDVTGFANGAHWTAIEHRVLKSIAQKLRDHAELIVVLRGHTDSRGTSAVNERLGLRRARFVSSALRRLGVVPDRIVVESVGAAEAVESGQSSTNRRVEIQWRRR